MNKLKHKITIVFIATLLATISVVQVFGASYFISGDFKCSMLKDYTISVAEYLGDDPDVVIPAQLIGVNVSEIDDYAFINNEDVASISFENGSQVKSFGYNAFYGCSSLTSVEFPEALTSIGEGAFQGCTLLDEALINASVSELKAQTFYGCTSLSNVELPETLESIGDYAFTGCSSLREIYVPNSVTSIGVSSFDSETVICCHYLSNAYTYADKNGYDFRIIDGYELGDVKMDGIINISDATEIQRQLAGMRSFDRYTAKLADFNGDGYVNIHDVTAIQKKIAGMDY